MLSGKTSALKYAGTAVGAAALMIGVTGPAAKAGLLYNHTTGQDFHGLTDGQKVCNTAVFDAKILKDLDSANAPRKTAAQARVVDCMEAYGSKIMAAITFSPQKPDACRFHLLALTPTENGQSLSHQKFPCISGRPKKTPLPQMVTTISEFYLTRQAIQENKIPGFMAEEFGEDLPVWEPFYHPAFAELFRETINGQDIATGFHGYGGKDADGKYTDSKNALRARGGSDNCIRLLPSDMQKVLDTLDRVSAQWNLEHGFYQGLPVFLIHNEAKPQQAKADRTVPPLSQEGFTQHLAVLTNQSGRD
jgi:hypothetical protein